MEVGFDKVESKDLMKVKLPGNGMLRIAEQLITVLLVAVFVAAWFLLNKPHLVFFRIMKPSSIDMQGFLVDSLGHGKISLVDRPDSIRK